MPAENRVARYSNDRSKPNPSPSPARKRDVWVVGVLSRQVAQFDDMACWARFPKAPHEELLDLLTPTQAIYLRKRAQIPAQLRPSSEAQARRVSSGMRPPAAPLPRATRTAGAAYFSSLVAFADLGLGAAGQQLAQTLQHQGVVLVDPVVVGGSSNSSAGTPKLARFCQWIRANDLAITACRPR